MTSARVVDDRCQRVAVDAHERRARREKEPALGPDRVGGAVAIRVVVGVVTERVDGLQAFEVDNSQSLTGAHDGGPRLAREHDLLEERVHAGTDWLEESSGVANARRASAPQFRAP